MKYIIYHSTVRTPSGEEAVGIEVQSGLGEAGAAGVAKEIVRQKPGFSTGRERISQMRRP